MNSQTIVLASGSRLLREMLKNIIAKTEQLDVVRELSELQQIQVAVQELEPDWVVIAPVQGDLPTEKIEAVLQHHPQTRLLLFPKEDNRIRLSRMQMREETIQGLSLSQLLKIMKTGYEGEEYFVNGIKHQDLKELIEHHNGPCVSLYMPTHGAGQESQQDPIRLKNLLVEAEQELSALDFRTPDIHEVLAPARALIPDLEFWMGAEDGLAVFLSTGLERIHSLPVRFEPFLSVGDVFHIKPLFLALSSDSEFFILALSKQQARLYQAADEGIQDITPDEMPTGIDQALRYDDPERQLQHHTSAQATAGEAGGDMIHHGHGNDYDEKTNLRRYFQQVDRAVQPILADQTSPLLLAAVDYLKPIYQEANTYNHLMEAGVSGNPEQWTSRELHAKAWPIVEPLFQQLRKDAIENFMILHGNQSERAVTKLEEIVRSAYSGQVETLFVAINEQRWGAFDLGQNLVKVHADYQPGDQDLFDLAAAYTLISGGQVFALPLEKIPGAGQVAAILRYAT